MIQNTSETRETLMRYTVPQLEAMVEALSENNKSEDDSNSKTLTGVDAMQFFIDNGGKL